MQQSSQHGVVLAALVMGSAACSNIFDAREYFISQKQDPTVDTSMGTPVYTEACMSCLETECGAELDACAADAGCSDNLRDVKECTSPECWFYGFEENGGILNAPINEPLGGLDRSLDGCMLNRCKTACRLRRNFDCAGHYDWPAHYEAGENIDLQVSSDREGLRVRACSSQFVSNDCNGFSFEGETDAAGQVTLTVPTAPQGFDGHILAESAETLPTVVRATRPLLDFRPITVNTTTAELFDELLQSVGKSFDPKRAYFSLNILDCNHWRADAVDVTVSTGDAETFIRKGPDCGGITDELGICIGGVPTGKPGTIFVHDEETGKPIIEIGFSPLAGAATFWEVWPATVHQPPPFSD